jgi:hypothetical protein
MGSPHALGPEANVMAFAVLGGHARLETSVCLLSTQTMPPLQEAARYAGDICHVVKSLIF